MKTPQFWHGNETLGRLLSPLGWLYYGISRAHRGWQGWRAHPQKLRAPVICVGNVTAGGAGKTPTVRMLATMLKIAGQEPHCVSRGYGGKPGKTPLRVDTQKHSAAEVGDEALMIAHSCPSWVATDRQAATIAAIEHGASIVIMDDGLQNPGFHKDISLLVIDREYGIGNGQLLPAGPLREPLNAALKRADGVILIGEGHFSLHTQLPVWNAQIVTTTNLDKYRSRPVIAFAGLARPEKFFTSLRRQGIELAATRRFADHHAYSAAELSALREEATRREAVLMTTAKDAVKLPSSMREQVVVVDIKLQLQQPKEFQFWLDDLIGNSEPPA